MNGPISRRLFLGGITSTAAAAPLAFEEGWEPKLRLDVDREIELSGDDVLVVRFPKGATLDEITIAKAFLEAEVWPNVLLVQEGVELEVIRRD